MDIDPIYLLQLTVNGITLGLLYALIAVGLALIFGVLEIVNFAHGEFLMAGAFAMTFALPATGISYWPSLFVAVVVTAVGGLILFELFLAPAHGAFERSILITLALSIIILHAAQLGFSGEPAHGRHAIRLRWLLGRADPASPGRGHRRRRGRRRVRAAQRVLNYTQFGRAMRADCAEPRGCADGRHQAARCRPQRCRAGDRAVRSAAPRSPRFSSVTPAMGQALIFKAFAW